MMCAYISFICSNFNFHLIVSSEFFVNMNVIRFLTLYTFICLIGCHMDLWFIICPGCEHVHFYVEHNNEIKSMVPEKFRVGRML